MDAVGTAYEVSANFVLIMNCNKYTRQPDSGKVEDPRTLTVSRRVSGGEPGSTVEAGQPHAAASVPQHSHRLVDPDVVREMVEAKGVLKRQALRVEPNRAILRHRVSAPFAGR